MVTPTSSAYFINCCSIAQQFANAMERLFYVSRVHRPPQTFYSVTARRHMVDAPGELIDCCKNFIQLSRIATTVTNR